MVARAPRESYFARKVGSVVLMAFISIRKFRAFHQPRQWKIL